MGEGQHALGQYDEVGHAWRLAINVFQTQHRIDDVHRVERQLAALDAMDR